VLWDLMLQTVWDKVEQQRLLQVLLAVAQHEQTT
jgi:hypothetical protein